MLYAIPVSRGIVALHRGRIGVYSEGEGRGCTFTVELPLYTDGTNNDPQSSSSAFDLESARCLRSVTLEREGTFYEASSALNSVSIAQVGTVGSMRTATSASHSTSSARESRLKVLVVDDAVLSRRMLRRYLETQCEEIMEASDGVEATARVAAEQSDGRRGYDIVLMDDNMPNMCGKDAARAMRRGGYCGLIIGVTGNASPEDVQEYLSHGADRVLGKPMDVNVLDAIVQGEPPPTAHLVFCRTTNPC